MPPKTKGKGKKGRNAEAARVEALLAQMRAVEAAAEDLQSRENARKEMEEKEERAAHAREEQLRLLHERDCTIDQLTRQLTLATAAQRDDRNSYNCQISQLCAQRDELLNTVSVLRAADESSRAALAREREHARERIAALRGEVDMLRASSVKDTADLRTQLHASRVALEAERARACSVVEAATAGERARQETTTTLQRDVAKVRALNAELQHAVERHEADDTRNVALMQMLTVQLDENRRHYEQHLDDERRRTREANDAAAALAKKMACLQDEHEQVKSRLATAQARADAALHEYEQQLEQVKLDATYLSSEIVAMRDECATLRRERDAATEAAAEATAQYAVELEALQKKTQEQERMLRQNELAYYDKMTFMNAQVVNNRAVIAQLQQKLDDERAAHEQARTQHARDVQSAEQQRSAEQGNAAQRIEELQASKAQLSEEVVQLKRAAAELRAAIKMREAEADTARQVHEAEMTRLRSTTLGAHAQSHDRGERLGEVSSTVDGAARCHHPLHNRLDEAQAREQTHREAEVLLRARIANQDDIIEALQVDLRLQERKHADQVQRYKEEIAVLRKTLDVHFISCAT